MINTVSLYIDNSVIKLEYVGWCLLQSVSRNNRQIYYNTENTHILTVEYTD